MEDIVMADETKPEEENGEKAATAEKKRKEPTSETLQNFSRVTPGQLPHISFPPDARFQPVRSFIPPSPAAKAKLKGASKVSMERHAGGGGIIMLIDRKPGEETKFVDLPPELGGEPPAAMNVDREPSEMLLDVPEAPMPEPFEVSHFSVHTSSDY
jgi:26S proteasome regulatory subunit N2